MKPEINKKSCQIINKELAPHQQDFIKIGGYSTD